MRTVRIISAMLPLNERMNLESSWDRLIESLERDEKQCNLFPKMDITAFPSQVRAELPPLMDSLMEHLDEHVISGHLADEVIEDGCVEEISVGS